MRLARLDQISVLDSSAAIPDGSAQMVHDEATLAMPLGNIIDIAQERARLERERQKVADEIASIDEKLNNKTFLEKAPDQVVKTQNERKISAQAAFDQLVKALERLA